MFHLFFICSVLCRRVSSYVYLFCFVSTSCFIFSVFVLFCVDVFLFFFICSVLCRRVSSYVYLFCFVSTS